jgi:hypothetical protein
MVGFTPGKVLTVLTKEDHQGDSTAGLAAVGTHYIG